MKICQEKQKSQKNNTKKSNIPDIQLKHTSIITKAILGCLIFGLISLILLQPELAKGVTPPIYVEDEAAKIQREKIAAGEESNFWEDFSWRKLLEKAREYSGVAFKSALGYFLNQLAYDTATYLATGDKGQKPMFITEGWGEYLANTADNAAGYFIEDLGKQGFDGARFNLCEPDFAIQYKITIGLQRWHKPHKPACTFSDMKNNWEEALQSDDFLTDFQNMFNPWENDLGIALSLQTQLGSEVDKKINESKDEAIKNKGLKDVTDSISDYIKTPASAVAKRMDLALEEATTKEKTYTGTVADAIDIFINTLVGKLFEEWFEKGLVTEFPEPKVWDYDDYEGQAQRGGIAGAKDRFRKLTEPNFSVRGDYDILGELVSCPDPTKAGPTNCVITENFRQAIINRMTVGNAMEQGYLDANRIFGFTSDGLEPDYYDEGYPYRSMIILRKFRIIPVGWELAAQYIKDFSDKTLNLSDLIACYEDGDDDGYGEYYEDWCKGLVDPSWVLKAPLNYCKREGPGPEIISEQIIGQGEDSEFAISRNDNYCADEQSCIKENNDGSCQLYGYCTEERRIWLFNGNSCEPKYNTCQTFRSRTGKTVSYLENTLDYDSCDADNAGCQAYCEDFDFASDSWNCTLATVGDKLYFDKDVGECDSDDEGCHEFIRTKAGVGANLLTNSSFEDDLADSIWAGDGAQVADGYDGQWALQLGVIGIDNKPIDVAPADYSVAGEIFSLSFYAKNCTAGDDFGIEADTAPLDEGGNWQYYQTTYVYPKIASGNQVNFTINTASCIIDAIKLERGLTATAYSGYRGRGLVYEKLAPDYLACAGAETDPDECNNFVRWCNENEVGCELYTSVTDDFSVPAKVIAQDYCAAECVGYDTYIQTETAFDSLRDEYFIPSTAQTCGAQAAGCDEFTNLDEVERGGEGIEYYIYLRQCIKPSDLGADCAEFYTWEGSDETGYQLRLHTLQEDLAGADGILNDPAVTSNDTTECNAAIYALPATDPGYNSDCREFYNSSGEISYHLYMRTISCDENCHPYRRTKNNIDPAITAAGDCNAAGSGYTDVYDWQFSWDGIYEVCYFCKNQGEWNNEHNACLYDAIPGQGVSCSAGQDGCREYSGNRGNNMRIVLNNDFEGSLQGWTGINGATAELSSMALAAGGESLYVHGANFIASTTVAGLVQENKSYVLSFIARSAGANQFNFIQLINGVDAPADFIIAPVALGGDWQLYKVNLARLEHDVSGSESLVITADGDFYIDDIRLTEITDRYYLIKNSWVTPDSCYEDILGNYVGPMYNLGCDEYYDRDRLTHYLHNFDQLCEESAVGCEIMIDTHNYSDYNSEAFNAGDPSEIIIPADSFVYVVYDRDKKCNSRDKGCQRLGDPYQYGSEVIYDDVYLLNNPDDYDSILCVERAVGCEEWTTSEGSSYFKDPGDMVCEWRQGYQDSWGWWKKKIKRCNGIGNICLTDNDCVMGEICELETADNTCNVSQYKTIGYGGQGNIIKQPANIGNEYWIGLCPASEAGCSEYIDPISKFSTNVIFNPDFSDIDSNGSFGDGWTGSSQGIEIDSYTLYVLRGNGASIKNCNGIRELLDDNNNLSGPVSFVSVNGRSVRFYSGTDTICTVAGGAVGNVVELRKAVVDYQLKQDVDKTTCNGIVDFEQGCVLFNERYQDGSAKASLIWDADLTVADGSGVTPRTGAAGQRDANVLLKVTPDRVCNQWLACRSFVKDEDDNNVCFDIGLCDSVDDNGNCNSFIITNKENQTYPNPLSADSISNMSGYTKVGYKNSSIKTDYYLLGAMEQEGQITNVPNGGFEFYGSNGYPIGWNAVGVSWDENKFSVINNPISAQVEGIGYPLEGRSFLKFSPSAGRMESEFIDVEPDTEYVLSAYMNTINFKLNIEDINNGLSACSVGILTYDNEGNQTQDPTGSSQDIVYCLHQPLGHGCGMYLAGGNDWTKILTRFQVGADTNKIKLVLLGRWWFGYTPPTTWANEGHCADEDSLCMGNVYIDDIKIRPALEVYDSPYSVAIDDPACTYTPTMDWIANRWQVDWIVPQSCRLYPQDDSLSCDYYEDSGKRQKGWLGYCLEYDRYPGSNDACLMWWPVDKVRGEGIEEGAGYADRFPLYYCVDKEDRIMTAPDERIRANRISGSCHQGNGPGDSWCYDLQGGYGLTYNGCCVIDEIVEKLSEPVFNIIGDDYIVQIGCATGLPCTDKGTISFSQDGKSWSVPIDIGPGGAFHSLEFGGLPFVEYIKIVNTTSVFGTTGILSLAIHEHYPTALSPYCSKLVQTVTPVGQNKYWSGRVYQGSNYKFSCNENFLQYNLTCSYLSDYPPFGSIVPPGDSWSIVVNPYEWDSKDTDGFQPLYYELPDESLSEPYQARMGQLHTTDSVQRLFAQSYGVWEWQTGEMCADGSFVQGETGMVGFGECHQYCQDGYCEGAFEVPENTPPNPAAITAAYMFSGSFYILDDQNWYAHAGGSWWGSGALADAWGGVTNAPQNFAAITAGYVLSSDNRLYILDNQNWYAYASPSWVASGALADAWGGVANAPQNFASITAGYENNGYLWILDNQNWYAYNAGTGWAAPADFGLPNNSLATVWGADPDPDAPEPPFSNITAGSEVGLLWILDDQDWHTYDSTRPADSRWTTGSLAERWEYATSTECVGGINDGKPCDPTVNNDCPGSHCIESGRYVPVSGQDWSVPDYLCQGPDGTRPLCSGDDCLICPGVTCDFCAILPKIDNIEVNKTVIQNTDFVNLTFNSIVDSQQLPLVMYAVDWGDGDQTVVSGVEMRDRANPDRPHSLYHLYSYWDLKARYASGVYGTDHWITCSESECSIQPKVKIKDNWGWCSKGSEGDQCPQGNSGWELGAWIVVRER